LERDSQKQCSNLDAGDVSHFCAAAAHRAWFSERRWKGVAEAREDAGLGLEQNDAYLHTLARRIIATSAYTASWITSSPPPENLRHPYLSAYTREERQISAYHGRRAAERQTTISADHHPAGARASPQRVYCGACHWALIEPIQVIPQRRAHQLARGLSFAARCTCLNNAGVG
jgi:hypothetical protein